MNEAFDPNRHVPVIEKVPDEDGTQMSDRKDIEPPSPYRRGARVTNLKTKQRAVVHRVDFITRQIRLWYPDRKDLPSAEQYDKRTEWHPFDHWEPELTLSPEEIERQEAVKQIALELEGLNADDSELILAFVDKGSDPRDQLPKIKALKKRFVQGATDKKAGK